MARSIKNISDRDHNKVISERLSLSFSYIDWDSEEFFLHGLEKNHYIKIFECLSSIKSSHSAEITQQTHTGLTPKSIRFGKNWTSLIKKSFPNSVLSKLKNLLKPQFDSEEEAEDQAEHILKDSAFEVRIAKSYGRVHGFIFSNIFHIVWFDPAHNLFPTNGVVKKHQDYATVKSFSPNEVTRLQEIIRRLQQEYAELYELLDSKTSDT